MKRTFIFLLILALLAGCNPTTPQNSSLTSVAPTFTVVPSNNTRMIVMNKADQVLTALKNKDMDALSTLVSPTQGVRFSPYAFVLDQDIVYSGSALKSAFNDLTIINWGVFDGSGEPIEMSFKDYYHSYIYNLDYVNAPQVGYNAILSSGNISPNFSTYFPNSIFIEYYFPGFDDQFSGMDWQSLSLVFVQEGNDWYLVGIVHSQWTI